MKKHGKAKYIMLAVLAAAILLYTAAEFLTGGVFFREAAAEAQTLLSTGVSVQFDRVSGAAFYACTGAKGFYFATKDGVSYITDDGRTLMNEAYSMQNPKLFGEGQFAAVAEPSGHFAYVFNPQGLLYYKQFEGQIVNLAINTLGYSSVVTKRNDKYEAFVYNASGVLISTGVFPETEIIVTSSDVSNDGRIWAISFLDISGAQMNSKITFSYLNKSESAGYTDNIFASINDDSNRYFGIVKFMDENKLVVVADKEIFCVNPSSGSMKALWTFELNNEIDKLCFDTGRIAIAFGKGLLNKPAEPQGRVVLIDLDMNRLAEYDAGSRVTSLSLGQAIIVGCERLFTAVSVKGVVLWEYTAVYDTRAMYFLDSTNKVLLQTGTEATVMKMTKVSAGPVEAAPPISGGGIQSEPDDTDSTDIFDNADNADGTAPSDED